MDNNNRQLLRQQILQKIYSPNPYFCPTQMFREIQTDRDSFPYLKNFRGQADSTCPHIYDREAGYQPILTSPSCVSETSPSEELTDLCFQIPCSTVLPCQGGRKCALPNTLGCVYISP